MIVISGVLVLVALVLLIIGVVGPDLTFVYASIGVSLVSLVFLVIGILQRRGETPAAETAGAPAPDVAEQPADTVTAVVPSQAARTSMRVRAEEAPVADSADEEPVAAGDVLVVDGRPRYHVAGCRYLSGKSAEAVEVNEARDEGFTPCGVCKPDAALAAAPGVQEEAEEEEVVEEDVPGVEVPAPTRTATRAVKAPVKKAAAKKASAKATEPATKAAPAKVAAAPARKAAPAKASAAKAAPAKAAATKATARTGTRTAAVKAPSKAASAAAAATPAAATAAKKAGSVVVIPERGKYHRGECRYVRDVDGAEVLSKSAATRQGYAACGVCRP